MMFTHEELTNAVREAGRDGQPFTIADVRSRLGLNTRDRSQLTRFQNRFRAFQKAEPEAIEKIGTNRYRLKELAQASESHAVSEPEPLAQIEQAEEAPLAAAGEPEPVELAQLGAEPEPIEPPQLAAVSQPERAEPPQLAAASALEAPTLDLDLPSFEPALDSARTDAPTTRSMSFQVAVPAAMLRTWREGSEWLGKRVAELLGRA
jgi:hypothetical protein